MDFAKGAITYGAVPNELIHAQHPGCVVQLGSGNLPESVVGTFLDVKTNSNKFYAVQRIRLPDGNRITCTLYGRIGGNVTMQTGSGFEFEKKVGDKFGCSFYNLPNQVASGKNYKVVFVEVAQTAITPKPQKALQPLENHIPRTILDLFRVILNAESIKESIVANALNVGIDISTKFAFPLQKVEAAKAICASVRNSPVALGIDVLQDRYGKILELIPMSASHGSAYQRVANAALDVRNWERFETVLDMLHQASLSLHQLEVKPAVATDDDSDDVAPDGAEFLTLLFEPQDDVLHSCGPRDVIETMKDLLPIAANVPLPYISKFLNLDCRLMLPNKKDFEICTRLLHNIRRVKFDIFSIMPQANRRKQFTGQVTGLFFHGTSISAVPAILASELNVKFCSGGRLGKLRIYLADNLLKSMQYASKDSQNSAFFFICEAPVPHNAHPSKVTVTTRDCDERDLSKILFADSCDCRYSAAINETVPDKYFDSGADACKLPDTEPVNTNVRGMFTNAEYTYGNNDQVALRYLIRVYF